MDDLFFLCHTDGTVVNVNRKTMEVLGVEEDGLAGQPIQECISRDVDLSSDKAITVPIRRKQYAQERIVQFRASPLYSRKGSKIGYIVLGSDITESAERQQQLRAAVEEKSVLLKEVYHRVKNNLQVIISLLDLRSGIIDDPDNKMLLLEEIARIRVISMVHNLIYERDDLRSIQIVPFTRNIIYMVAEIFELPLLDITLDIHLPEIELNMDRGVIFGLIMYEAINNAFKHVFSAGGKGVLRVTGTDENGHIRIVVANNAGDSAPGRNKDTLGITLMEMLSAQIDGSLEVIKPGGGDTGEWSVVIDFAREN
jgi:PAS domain S-box-containing protein